MQIKKILFIFLLCFILIQCKKNENSVDSSNCTKTIETNNIFNPETNIRLGVIFSMSGSEAITNQESVYGVKLAVERINAEGGILGKKIYLSIYDNNSTAIGSKLACEQAVKDGVIGIIGCQYSSHSLGAAPIAQAAGIPMISNISTNEDVTLVGDYIFRVCFIDSFQGIIISNFAYKELKAKTASIMINADADYSKEIAKYFKEDFTKLSGIVIGEYYFQAVDKDFSNQLSEIKKNNPNILFVPAYLKEAALICKQARIMGITAAIIGSDGWSHKMLKYAGEYLEGCYYINHWTQTDDKKNIEFVKEYYKSYGEIEIPAIAALAYDAVFLLSDAIKRAGSFDKKFIRDSIANTKNFQGITGTISFDKNRNPVKTAFIVKFQNDKVVLDKIIIP